MHRAVLLALLVALAVPLGVAGAQPTVPSSPSTGAERVAVGPAPGDGQAPGTGVRPDIDDVAILTLRDGGRSGFATPTADVATALAVQREVAAARLDRYALAERLAAAESAEVRKTLLFEAATDVEIRIASLRGEERQLRANYANRSIDTETFLTRLARLDARAVALRATLAAIRGHADNIRQFSMDGRVQLLEAGLSGLEGPVRERALVAVRGEGSPARVSVVVSETGVVLSTLDDGRFVREAYRADNLDPETVGGTSFDEAVDITKRLYAPYAYNESITLGNGIVSPSPGIYRFTMELQTGRVNAFLDGSTGAVFFEVQERQVDQLDAPEGAVGAANGTRLVANRSYPGGPMRLAVTDSETGEPVAATVVVAGHAVATGEDGVAWTLAPADPVDVTAVGPDGNVTLSVRPLAPTAVGDREG